MDKLAGLFAASGNSPTACPCLAGGLGVQGEGDHAGIPKKGDVSINVKTLDTNWGGCPEPGEDRSWAPGAARSDSPLERR